jgi:hypothetical protein
LAELIRRGWEDAQIVDFTSQLNDFSDTTALAENLDIRLRRRNTAGMLFGGLWWRDEAKERVI